MTEPTFDDGLSDQEGQPGEIGTPEGEAGPSELDPRTVDDDAQ